MMSGEILVPVDGSEHAFRALEVACGLAKAENKGIRLLHVVPSRDIPEGLKRYAALEHINDSPEHLYETAIADNVLNAARGQTAAAGIEEVECSVEHGEASKGILAAASHGNVDTIVIGTRGLSDIQGLVFGSVAHKVAHGAACRVVAVK
jgi:nucleotide-binding universal stress UspA family protein